MNLDDTIALLRRTPAILDAWLRDAPDSLLTRNEGGKTFSAFDVVGHLIHGERTDWIPRARIILDFGESRPFDKFDRFAQFELSRGKSIGELLDEFARLRTATIHELHSMSLDAARLSLRGTHPSLGTVTLAQLLATWAAHDLTHLHQISRVMAHQYRDDVGPWSAYMMQNVLERDRGYDWLDSEPRTMPGKEHRPAYGSDGDYWSKPNRETIFECVYELMHEAMPKKYPRFL